MPGLCIIPQRAMRDKECRNNRLVALCAIGSFTSRDGGGVWAANETIAETCVLDEREFRRAAAWLVERGYVRKKVRYKASGAQDTNLLQVVLDEPDESSAAASMVGGEKVPTPLVGEGEKSPPPVGEKSPPALGEFSPPRGGEKLPTKRTPLNLPSERPRAAAAGEVKPMRPLQQLAAAANRAFDERFGTDRQPIVSNTATNLLEAITQHAIPLEWAVQAVYEAAQRCDNPKVRSIEYFREVVLERWHREQARDDAKSFVPAAGIIGSRLPARAWVHDVGRAAFWDLCVSGGLAAGMQSRETLAERVQVLHREGLVSDPDVFLALVLHVKPWALAEITFRKERDERLAAALNSFTAPAAQEVA